MERTKARLEPSYMEAVSTRWIAHNVCMFVCTQKYGETDSSKNREPISKETKHIKVNPMTSSCLVLVEQYL